MYYFFVLKAMCQVEIKAECWCEYLINLRKYGIFLILQVLGSEFWVLGVPASGGFKV
jgi:hypothetical protein